MLDATAFILSKRGTTRHTLKPCWYEGALVSIAAVAYTTWKAPERNMCERYGQVLKHIIIAFLRKVLHIYQNHVEPAVLS